MANTYTWEIITMKTSAQVDTFTNVVTEVMWSCIGTNGTVTLAIPGLTKIEFDSGADFTPYDSLTKAEVLSWVWASGADKTLVESRVASRIDVPVAPEPQVLPLPWN